MRGAPAGTRRTGRASPSALPIARGAVVALLVAALGVFHIWSRTRVVAAGYRLGALQAEHAKLTTEHDRLRIEELEGDSDHYFEQRAEDPAGVLRTISSPFAKRRQNHTT